MPLPRDQQRQGTLASHVRSFLEPATVDPEISNLNGSTRSRFPLTQRPPTDISKLVKFKCTYGDTRGAQRLLISENSLATQSEDTASALRAKHPPGVASILPDTNQPDVQPLQVDSDDVLAALSRMQSGSDPASMDCVPNISRI